MAIKFLNTVAVDTNVLYVDAINNRVGIGTNNPDARLSVSDDGQAVFEILPFTNDYGTTLRSYDTVDEAFNYLSYKASIHRFHIGDAEKMTIKGSGNVGIGTTAPAAKLHVKEPSGSTSQIKMSAASNEANYGYLTMLDNTVNTAKLTFGTTYGYNTPVDAMTIFNGKVGIGTASPSFKLEVLGNSKFTDTLNVNSSALGAYIYSSQSTGLIVRGGGNSQDIAQFQKVGGSTIAVIDSGGDVGLGTTSPNQKLHVNGATQLGDISATVNFGTVALKVVEGTVATGPTLGSGAVGAQAVLYSNGLFGMYTGVSNSGDTWMQSQRNDANTATYDILLNPAGGRVAIGHNNPVGWLDVFRTGTNYAVNLSDTLNRAGLVVKSSGAFDSKIAFSSGASSRQYIQAVNNAGNTGRDISINPYGGNVGVGTSAPGQKLTVNGRALIQNSTTPFYIKVNSTYKSWVHHIASNDTYVLAPSTADGGETWDWPNQTSFSTSGVVTANNFVLSSDKRNKTKIEDLTGNNVNISWKSFEMKGNEGEYRTGVIAQELEENHPEFVNTDDRGFKSVKYIDLLIAKIAELEARLEMLEK